MSHTAEKVPKLKHSDLITTTGEWFEFRKRYRTFAHPELLRPMDMPVHPKVAKSDLPYKRDFVEEVRDAVPKLVIEDLKAIRDRLGTSLQFQVKPEGIFERNYREPIGDGFKYEEVNFIGNGRGTIVEKYATSIWFTFPTDEQDNDRFTERYEGQFPESIARAYRMESEGAETKRFYTWQQHNPDDMGFAFALYLRNFAISFNNLGLDKLQ